MRTIIISAFPGMGKSYFCQHYNDSLDLESSKYSHLKTGDLNLDFPYNYISAIKKNIGLYRYIFISSHKDVRDALLDNSLFFYVVIPTIEEKSKYLDRYSKRHNKSDFIKKLEENYSSWIRKIE